MSETFTGGCLCGAIRYQCTHRIRKVVVCHCVDCRKAHGTPAGYNARVRRDLVSFTKGEPKTFDIKADSGLVLRRMFCGECGSQLFSSRENMPEYLSIKVGSLDDPSALEVANNIWTSSALPWLPIDEELPNHQQDVPELSPQNLPVPGCS